MDQLGSKLRLTFYDASDGPRIVLFGPADADFQSLQRLFVRLSQTPEMTCELADQPFIAAFGGTKVLLVCSGPMFPHKRSGGQGIRRVESVTLPVFEWRRSAEAWDYLAELIDPIVKESTPGHHYLTRYPGEDAIVVLSKGEYGDNILQK
jgi:hypothetical protein